MSGEVVLFDVDERGVATATLNRPEVRNAYDGRMLDALASVVQRCENDHGVRVLVLRGNGPVFQAGADLGWLASLREGSDEENLEVSRRTAHVFRALLECSKPVVALVHGGCFGGGVGFVAACDVAVAASDAQFAITEARWGLLPSIIVPQLLGSIGLRNVRRYALSCERFDAGTAHSIGLVHEVCEVSALDESAAPILEGLLSSAPNSLSQLKKLAIEQAGAGIDEALFERLVRLHADKRGSAEAREGLASFRDKRPPAWLEPRREPPLP